MGASVTFLSLAHVRGREERRAESVTYEQVFRREVQRDCHVVGHVGKCYDVLAERKPTECWGGNEI